jgi:hypothetical protein
MKNLFFAIIAIVAFGTVNAQENVVKLNPAGLAFGTIQLSYEKALNSSSAAELSIGYTNVKAKFDSEDAKISGFGAELKYKFYFSSSYDAPRGWYAAPLINYSSANGSSNNKSGKVSAFGGGVVGGYQWIFGGGATGFALDINLGAQFLSANVSGDITSSNFDGFLPRLGVSLGYGW